MLIIIIVLATGKYNHYASKWVHPLNSPIEWRKCCCYVPWYIFMDLQSICRFMSKLDYIIYILYIQNHCMSTNVAKWGPHLVTFWKSGIGFKEFSNASSWPLLWLAAVHAPLLLFRAWVGTATSPWNKNSPTVAGSRGQKVTSWRPNMTPEPVLLWLCSCYLMLWCATLTQRYYNDTIWQSVPHFKTLRVLRLVDFELWTSKHINHCIKIVGQIYISKYLTQQGNDKTQYK